MFLFAVELFTSGSLNLIEWPLFVKTNTDDPEGFFDNGSWTFLGAESEGKTIPRAKRMTRMNRPTTTTGMNPTRREDYSEASEVAEMEVGYFVVVRNNRVIKTAVCFVDFRCD